MSEELVAGRELDALIAEKVMGKEVSWWSLRLVDRPPTDVAWRHGLFTSDASLERMEEGEVLVASPDGDMPFLEMSVNGDWDRVPNFSTDIGAAWKVVEKVMERDGMYFELERNSVRGTQWRGTFSPLSQPVATALGPTAPLAICLAALNTESSALSIKANGS